MRYIAMAALMGLAFSSPVGGKPSGGGGHSSPSTTDPQVAYVYIGGNRVRQIRLANEDGTGSATLATSSATDVTVRLAPRAQHQLVYASGRDVHLLTYQIASTGPSTISDVVIGGDATGAVAFSPTGTQVAWLNSADNGIYLEDLGTKSTQLLVNVGTAFIGDFDFSSDGSHLIYTQSLPPNTTIMQFRSMPVSGGDAVDLPIQGPYGNFRVGRTEDSIVAGEWGTNAQISFFPPGSSSSTPLVKGSRPALRCDDHVMIYMTTSRSSETTLKYDLTTSLGSTFGSSAYFPDYFPDC